MEFKEAVNYRQSIRYFTNQQIAPDDLKEIVQLAQRTPSWANSQPWQVYIATGQTLEKIKNHHLAAAQQGVSGNSDFPVAHRTQWGQQAQKNMVKWEQDLQTYLGDQMPQMSAAQAHLFNAAALVYLVLPQGATDWSVYDLGAFIQTLMLAAAEKKIDSMPAYEIVRYPDAVRDLMDIPADQQVAMGIALGYRDPAYQINGFRTKRTTESTILTIKD